MALPDATQRGGPATAVPLPHPTSVPTPWWNVSGECVTPAYRKWGGRSLFIISRRFGESAPFSPLSPPLQLRFRRLPNYFPTMNSSPSFSLPPLSSKALSQLFSIDPPSVAPPPRQQRPVGDPHRPEVSWGVADPPPPLLCYLCGESWAAPDYADHLVACEAGVRGPPAPASADWRNF